MPRLTRHRSSHLALDWSVGAKPPEWHDHIEFRERRSGDNVRQGQMVMCDKSKDQKQYFIA